MYPTDDAMGKITLKIQLPSYLKEKKNTRDT